MQARLDSCTRTALSFMGVATAVSALRGIGVPGEFTLFFSMCAGLHTPRLLRGAAAALEYPCAILVAACRQPPPPEGAPELLVL